MSDTPRTDGMEPYGPPYKHIPVIHVPKAFARQLERELKEAHARLSCMRQIISRAADEVKRLQDEVTRMRDERDFEKKLRKDQSDRAGSWKECAELLAKHVQGVSDEDCKALEVFEKLKAREG